jgi:muramoyltetrapeptide carboxypeptidase
MEMGKRKLKIAIVAPGSRIDPGLAQRVGEIAASAFPSRVELHFHPQCFLASGHFAGDDAARAAAFVEVANDENFDAVWFARGGYGAGRIVARVLPRLSKGARRKTYLGYSDTGTLLAALYGAGFRKLAHGPMPSDVARDGGEAAIRRALSFLVDRAPEALEPSVASGTLTAAFNITILSHLIGTPFQPNLGRHVLLLEDVAEQMYRIDRALFHITSNAGMRRVAGIKLGRCSAIPLNDPDFGQDEEQVARHWCAESGIAWLGRADIGHDVGNKIVPLGKMFRI